MPRYFTIGIIARRLGQHPSTLDRLNRKGLFPHAERVDGCRFWSPELIAAIETHIRHGRVSEYWIIQESKRWERKRRKDGEVPS